MASLSGLRVAPGNIGVLIVLNEVSNFWSKIHRTLTVSTTTLASQHQLQQEDDKIDFMQP